MQVTSTQQLATPRHEGAIVPVFKSENTGNFPFNPNFDGKDSDQ